MTNGTETHKEAIARLELELQQGRSALRWFRLAMWLSAISSIGSISAFILIVINSRYGMPTLLVSLMIFLLSAYCRQMGVLIYPKSWKSLK